MGYNISKFVIKRNQAQLDQLVEASSNILFPSDKPHRLAEKIREALNATWHFPEFKHYYDKLNHRWRFRIVAGGVLAEIKEDMSQGRVVVREQFPVVEIYPSSIEEPDHRPALPPTKKVIAEAYTLLDVFGFCIRFPHDIEVHFPNVILNDEEKERLFVWASNDGRSWKYIDQDRNGLTLTQRDDVPEEILWKATA